MNLKLRSLAAACALACASTGVLAGALPESQLNNAWYQQGEQLIEQKSLQTRNISTAKNVILFVGDGMGISTLTAARILEGQLQGNSGEEHFLSFETFPHTALVKTYNTDQQTPDSAGTMTAMMTGVKNRAGVIGLGPMAKQGECKDIESNALTSALTLAERKGKATGIVSTARITHATPAATYAIAPHRDWEDDSKLPEDATDCTDIASQLINYSEGDGIEVALGGGRRHFITTDQGGRRTDGVDLTQQWLNAAGTETRTYVTNKTELSNADIANSDKLLGLFTSSHMSYEADRDDNEEPSLAEMTETALEVLKKDQDGFFLMVEGGRIDHGHHAGNAYRALTDAHAFAEAVQTAVDNTNGETLIIVTADHSHVFTIAGYPKRGNPILGKVVQTDDTEATDTNGLPYTTVGYMNGRGFADLETGGDTRYDSAIVEGRVDLTNINTEGQGFHQETLIPRSSETHAGEDISVHAIGPGAHLFSGVIEQNEVFHVINDAADLGGTAY